MKYKVLINSKKSALMKDFFQHTSRYFDNLSTSDLQADIVKHFQLFSPDVYVCFFDSYDNEQISQINALKISDAYNKAPVVIIANNETCNEIQMEHPLLADLIIRRPVSPDNLSLAIINYLDKAKEEAKRKEEEEKISKEVSSEPKTEEVKKHILLIDDDRGVLKMLKAALSDKYEVTTIINGIIAEKFLESKTCDLVILDYEMPVKTGYEVFKSLKQSEKTKDIPVVFLTGVSDSKKIAEIMLLKPHGYMLKPINMDMLLTTIKNILG
jgi:DNA-binding NtrC family response regulator